MPSWLFIALFAVCPALGVVAVVQGRRRGSRRLALLGWLGVGMAALGLVYVGLLFLAY